MNLDTHYYDTKWHDRYIELVKQDDERLHPPPSMKQCIDECFRDAQSLFKGRQISVRGINMIVRVLRLFVDESHPDNNDTLNRVKTSDIFPRVWRFVRHYDLPMKLAFYEQIADIIGGSCAQGRTTRLFQFYQLHSSPDDSLFRKLASKGANKTTDQFDPL